MSKLLSVLLLGIYAVVLIRPLVPYIDYVVNHDYIVKNLCENKEKPKMFCNGKCHLKKELKKVSTEEQERKAALPERNTEEYIVSYSLAETRFPAREIFVFIESSNHYDFHIKTSIPDIPTPPPKLNA